MKLFEKNAIGRMKLKNRMIMSPMGTASDPDGGFSEQNRNYYVERAKGGFGLIILECCIASEAYETRPNKVLDSFHKVGRLADLIDRCHQYGAKVCVQLSPGCGRMGYSDPNTPPYAASAVPSVWFPTLTCRPFTTEQIHDIVEKFGFSAKLAQTAGADAIELQGYGGYLIDQFMTEAWNARTDEYGGGLENRMRFPLALIRQIQRTCGNDFPILFKYSVTHEVSGGRKLEEGLRIAEMLEQAGVAALHVCFGSHESYYQPVSSVYSPEASKVHLAEQVKRRVTIPVFCDGKLGDPALAERMLAEGKTDYIALAKQSLADPYWPEKVRQNRPDTVRRCLYCCECHQGMHDGKFLMCAVNPQCGNEGRYEITKTDTPQRVLVIGGGPGGMQAAITAAERGHTVELWEKRAVLGGNLRAAAGPAFKHDVKMYLEYLIRQLYQSGATVRLGKQATNDKVLAYRADAVILAVGAQPLTPPIPGVDGEQVVTAAAALEGGVSGTGRRAVVIGGGLVGCETALHLHQQGVRVAIVEMMDGLVPREQMNPNNRQLLMKLIDESGIEVLLQSKVSSIEAEGVRVAQADTERLLPCDCVVLAAGFRANDELEQALENDIERLYVIGDCAQPGKVYTAVHEGFHTARLL